MTLGPITDRYDFYTVEDTPFTTDRGLVTVGEWGVSYDNVIGSGIWTLKAYKMDPETYEFEYHAVSGSVSSNREDLVRQAYNHGLLQYMVKK